VKAVTEVSPEPFFQSKYSARNPKAKASVIA